MNMTFPTPDLLPATHLLKAMGNEARLMILCELGGGERSVGTLQRRIGLGQSALSQHLAVLRRYGLVGTRRDSRTIYYSLGDPVARRIIETLSRVYCTVST